MRTIVTKMTQHETKPTTIRASSEKCHVTITRGLDDYATAHIRAVKALFAKYGWGKQRMYGNELGDKIVWVPVNKELKI